MTTVYTEFDMEACMVRMFLQPDIKEGHYAKFGRSEELPYRGVWSYYHSDSHNWYVCCHDPNGPDWWTAGNVKARLSVEDALRYLETGEVPLWDGGYVNVEEL